MDSIKCYLLEKTNRIKRELRRYAPTEDCSGPLSYHNSSNFLDIVNDEGERIHDWDHNDPRWPTACFCGYEFKDNDKWQLFNSRLYLKVDTNQEFTLSEAPPGAIWHADYLDKIYPSPDGKVYSVKLPNGNTWTIDGRANNCTLPEENTHNCWVRHGEPPNFTVDKQGHSCSAGAGSIVSGGWHGFLTNGILREC